MVHGQGGYTVYNSVSESQAFRHSTSMATKSANSITIVTGVLIVYIITTNLPVSFGIVFAFFLLTGAGLFWMVICILKDTSNPSNKTFDEHFYEDVD
jgi:hypothetical protein